MMQGVSDVTVQLDSAGLRRYRINRLTPILAEVYALHLVSVDGFYEVRMWPVLQKLQDGALVSQQIVVKERI